MSKETKEKSVWVSGTIWAVVALVVFGFLGIFGLLVLLLIMGVDALCKK